MGKLNCKNRKKICIGDLNRLITLQLRSLEPPSNIDFIETYTNVASIWSYVEIVSDYFTFSKTNIDESITHRFYVRFRTDITIDNWILFDSNRYTIVSIKDPDFTKEFLQLNCNLKGDVSEESSKW